MRIAVQTVEKVGRDSWVSYILFSCKFGEVTRATEIGHLDIITCRRTTQRTVCNIDIYMLPC